jgi:hypothetical protein
MVDVQLLSDYQRVIVNNWDDHRNILGLNEVRKPTITNHAIVRVQPKKCGRDQGNPMEKKRDVTNKEPISFGAGTWLCQSWRYPSWSRWELRGTAVSR